MVLFLCLERIKTWPVDKEFSTLKVFDSIRKESVVRIKLEVKVGKSLINEPVFAELGKKYGKSPAQIILRWHTQMGFVVIPGSKNVDHIKDDLNILDFKLTDEELAKIAELDKNERYYHRTDEQLVQFAGWRPTFEKA